MFDLMRPSHFQDIRKAHQIAFDIDVWVVNGMTNSSLGCQIYDDLGLKSGCCFG